jgi:hypothetical protein
METRIHSDKATTTATTMTRLRKLAITMLAAITVATGSLTMVPKVSAQPRSCEETQQIVNMYWATGWAYYSIGAYAYAYYWWGKADGLAQAGC